MDAAIFKRIQYLVLAFSILLIAGCLSESDPDSAFSGESGSNTETSLNRGFDIECNRESGDYPCLYTRYYDSLDSNAYYKLSSPVGGSNIVMMGSNLASIYVYTESLESVDLTSIEGNPWRPVTNRPKAGASTFLPEGEYVLSLQSVDGDRATLVVNSTAFADQSKLPSLDSGTFTHEYSGFYNLEVTGSGTNIATSGYNLSILLLFDEDLEPIELTNPNRFSNQPTANQSEYLEPGNYVVMIKIGRTASLTVGF